MSKINKKGKNNRAVSPVLAVLMMVAVAVAASLVAYAWIMNYLAFTTAKTGKAIQIQSFAAKSDGSELWVYVQNVGQGIVELDPDGCSYINNELKSASIEPPTNTLDEGYTATLTIALSPPLDVTETAKIRIIIKDGTFTEVSSVPFTSEEGNHAPIAVADSYGTDEDTTLNIPAPGVLTNDNDLDGDTLSAVLVSGPSNGILDLNSDGSFSYTPNVDYVGSDSFDYKANDGSLDSNTVTVLITVNSVNDAPVIDSFLPVTDPTVLEGGSQGFSITCHDPDGTTPTVSWLLDDYEVITGLSYTYSPDFNSAGLHTVKVVVSDGSLTAEHTWTITVTNVNQAPNAAFSFNPSNPSSGDIISFTDGSSDPDGTIASWSWDFGDGDTSTLQNPTHSYSSSGTYTMGLTVTDNEDATDYVEHNVLVANVPPTCDFDWSPKPPNVDQSVSFTGTGNDPDGSIVSWSWDFGDGGTSPLQNPIHIYTTSGDKTVVLTVTDNNDATGTRTHTVIVNALVTGSITIYKDALPNDPQTFGYTTTGGLTPSTFNLVDNGGANYQTFTGLTAGTYTITEMAPSSPWTFDSITIVDSNGGSSSSGRTATVVISAGEDVTVTFANKKLGSIRVIKDSQPNNAQSFGFTDTGLTPASFSLTDNGGINYRDFTELASGTYTLTESAVTGWSLTGIIIVDPTLDSTSNMGTRVATLVVGAGEDVTVTFVNKRNSDAQNLIQIPGFQTDSTWVETVNNLQNDRANRYYDNDARTGGRDGRTDTTRNYINNGAAYAMLSQSLTPTLISNIPDISNSLSLWLRNRGIDNNGVSVEVRVYSGSTMLSYIWCPSGQVPAETSTTKYIRIGNIPGTTYVNLARNLRTDWIGKGLLISAYMDKIELVSNGQRTSGTEYGQDIVWDDLQLLYIP